MKKLTLILFTFLFAVTFKSFGQKLEENKFDDDIKKNVKQTSWESLASSSIVNAHFCFVSIGDHKLFHLKLMMNKIFAINSDQQLIFKMVNGDTVSVFTQAHAITCTGCGAVGFAGSGAEGLEVIYELNSNQVAKLQADKIINVTVFTVIDSFDMDIKEKNATKFQASLNLL